MTDFTCPKPENLPSINLMGTSAINHNDCDAMTATIEALAQAITDGVTALNSAIAALSNAIESGVAAAITYCENLVSEATAFIHDTVQELENYIKTAFDSLRGQGEALNQLVGDLAPYLQLLSIPKDLGSVITWISKVIKIVITPEVEAARKAIAESTELSTCAASVTTSATKTVSVLSQLKLDIPANVTTVSAFKISVPVPKIAIPIPVLGG